MAPEQKLSHPDGAAAWLEVPPDVITMVFRLIVENNLPKNSRGGKNKYVVALHATANWRAVSKTHRDACVLEPRDRDVVLQLLKEPGWKMNDALHALQLGEVGVKWVLQWADPLARSDPKFVLKVLRRCNNGTDDPGDLQWGLPWVDASLRANAKFMLKVVELVYTLHEWVVLKYADPALRSDPAFVRVLLLKYYISYLELVEKTVLPWVDPASLADPKFVRNVFPRGKPAEVCDWRKPIYTKVLEFAPSALRADRDLMKLACEGFDLKLGDAAMRADPDVVREAMLRDPSQLKFASEALRTDSEFVLSTMDHRYKESTNVLEYSWLDELARTELRARWQWRHAQYLQDCEDLRTFDRAHKEAEDPGNFEHKGFRIVNWCIGGRFRNHLADEEGVGSAWGA